jgi:Na+-translocating ferredoxin:NAD+ oxidoreductase RnfC subunit
VKVPVGTPTLDVLKMSGIEDFSNYGVIAGGPMMGPLLSDLNGYITKKDKGFIILKKSHPLIRKKSTTFDQARRVNRAACEQCRMCTDLCPRYLLGHNMEPHKLMRVISYAPNDVHAQLTASLCCQCNLCEYFSCPGNLHPRTTSTIFKQNMAQAGVRYQPTESEFHARPQRENRLVPSKRLVARLSLRDYDRPAPWTEETLHPTEVHISTRQHVGAPAVPVVSVGESVSAGQMVGKIPDGALGAPVHASISGTVTECGNDFIVIRMG